MNSILFQADMVRANLDGRKTQTRRIIKFQEHGCLTGDCPHKKQSECDACLLSECPYGQPGNQLWVKETFQRCTKCQQLNYRATANFGYCCQGCDEPLGKWKPSIFMPQDASRLTLDVTHVRAERLQEISEADALCEGVQTKRVLCPDCGFVINKAGNPGASCPEPDCRGILRRETAVEAYRELWNSINLAPSPIYETQGKRKVIVGYQSYPWSAEDTADFADLNSLRGKPLSITPNPYVWVITYKPVGPNSAQ